MLCFEFAVSHYMRWVDVCDFAPDANGSVDAPRVVLNHVVGVRPVYVHVQSGSSKQTKQ